MRISLFLTAILVSIGCTVTALILSWDPNAFKVADKTSNIISLWACIAAFVSAAFVIRSYIQTNHAFVLSQKPHLGLIVENVTINNGTDSPQTHGTRIHYNNMTLNPFLDLTIKVMVKNSKATVDLSNLFSSSMFMAGQDRRQRIFSTRLELLSRGFELESEFTAKDIPQLFLSYEFTFQGALETISVQQYVWNVQAKQWQIA